MLDVNDFIAERGGNPEAIRESQRVRLYPPCAILSSCRYASCELHNEDCQGDEALSD